jgi:3',5'-cyclic-AMP phosphodiesterase
MHLVNVPAVAWLFDKTQPRGFVTARLRPDGATLVLHALDHQHAKHGETIDLKWRA